MNDAETSIDQLRQLVADFVAARDWQTFHSPKNISMALAIEAAELMEHFQWVTIDASRELPRDPAKRHEIGEELADVICYSLAMANTLGLDVATIVREKMKRNEAKYPVDRYRGRFG